jgi:hypothetical protein
MPKFVRSNFAQAEVHGVCAVGILEIQSGLQIAKEDCGSGICSRHAFDV